MRIILEIPDELMSSLNEVHGSDLSRAALEHFAVEGYRAGKLSRFQVQMLLGFEDRWCTEAWLGRNGVNLNYSADDLEADRNTLQRLLDPAER